MGAWCGTTYVASLKPGDTCPVNLGGGVATQLAPGTQPPATNGGGRGTNTTVTGQALWNQDSTPVQLEPERTVGRPGNPEQYAPTQQVWQAREVFNDIWGAGSAANASKEDRQRKQTLLAQLRAYTGSKLGTRGAAESAWADALKDASRAGVDVFTLLSGGGGAGGGSGSGGGGGLSTANLPAVNLMGEADIAFLANEEAMALVGRELSKQELSRIVKDVRRLEQANPTVRRVVNGRVVTSGGVSAATLSDLIKERAAEIATKGLDAAAPLKGDAARQAESLRQWAKSNGVGLSDQALSNYTRRIITGKTTMDDVKADLRRTYLAGAYPAWADRINAGEDPSDFLSPYVSKARDLLEREDLQLDDPLVRRMTQYVSPDGKPSVLPLFEAEKLARKDDRWQYTNNAQEQYARAANQILSMFGLR